MFKFLVEVHSISSYDTGCVNQCVLVFAVVPSELYRVRNIFLLLV